METILEILKRTKKWIIVLFIINVILNYGMYGHFFWDLINYLLMTLCCLIIPFFIGFIVYVSSHNIDKTVSYINTLMIILSVILVFSIYGQYFVLPKYS